MATANYPCRKKKPLFFPLFSIRTKAVGLPLNTFSTAATAELKVSSVQAFGIYLVWRRLSVCLIKAQPRNWFGGLGFFFFAAAVTVNSADVSAHLLFFLICTSSSLLLLRIWNYSALRCLFLIPWMSFKNAS